MSTTIASVAESRRTSHAEVLDEHLVWLDERRDQADPLLRQSFDASIESIAHAIAVMGFDHFNAAGPDHANDVGVRTGSIQLAPSGTQFFYREPKHESILIGDMAHHLARQRRFNGGSNASVAQHLVMGCEFFPERLLQKCWFMHDGEEYVTGDMASPLKFLVGSAFKPLADNVRSAIFARFGLPPAWAYRLPKRVKEIDSTMLEWERRDQMPTSEWYQKQPLAHLDTYPAWSTEMAQSRYLEKFAELWPNEKI